MASSSKRFSPIRRLASDQERKAATALGDSIRSRREAEQRLAELRDYRSEYLERYRTTAQAGATAATLRDYQNFLGRLEQAITEQERVLAEAEAQCSQSQHRWRDRHQHNQALEKVLERLRRDENRATEKREQDEQDERGQRRR